MSKVGASFIKIDGVTVQGNGSDQLVASGLQNANSVFSMHQSNLTTANRYLTRMSHSPLMAITKKYANSQLRIRYSFFPALNTGSANVYTGIELTSDAAGSSIIQTILGGKGLLSAGERDPVAGEALTGKNHLAWGKTVTCSSEEASNGWLKTNAIDGGLWSTYNDIAGSGGYLSNSNTGSDHAEWYKVDLGAAYDLDRLVIWPRSDQTAELGRNYPKNFTIETSPDNSNWTTRHTLTGLGITIPAQPYSLLGVNARYIKLNATSLNTQSNGQYRLCFCEFDILGPVSLLVGDYYLWPMAYVSANSVIAAWNYSGIYISVDEIIVDSWPNYHTL